MIVYELPLPPSVNAMFANRGVKGAFNVGKESVGIGRAPAPQRGRTITGDYKSWRRQANAQLMTQCPLKTVLGPVDIRITITERACGDLDNRCKAILDFIVHHKIIEDDCRSIVRSIFLQWGDVEGARVEIAKVGDWIARKLRSAA